MNRLQMQLLLEPPRGIKWRTVIRCWFLLPSTVNSSNSWKCVKQKRSPSHLRVRACVCPRTCVRVRACVLIQHALANNILSRCSPPISLSDHHNWDGLTRANKTNSATWQQSTNLQWAARGQPAAQSQPSRKRLRRTNSRAPPTRQSGGAWGQSSLKTV